MTPRICAMMSAALSAKALKLDVEAKKQISEDGETFSPMTLAKLTAAQTLFAQAAAWHDVKKDMDLT